MPAAETEAGRPLCCRALYGDDIRPWRVALKWTVSQPGITSVITAARSTDRLGENIRSLDIPLTAEDRRELDVVSHPGTPYPRGMMLKVDQAEDLRTHALEPNLFTSGAAWKNLRKGEQK